MKAREELSPRELFGLKEVLLTGRTTDRIIASELLRNDMVVTKQNILLLTPKGRKFLVRGSPLLWDIAS